MECSNVNLYPLLPLNLLTNATPMTSFSSFAIRNGKLFFFMFFIISSNSLVDNGFSSKFANEFIIK